MREIKEKALELAIKACAPEKDPKNITRMAQAFEEYLSNATASGPQPEPKNVERHFPATFQRITDTAGNTYDKHTLPPFLNPNAQQDAKPADPISDIYDMDKMSERGRDPAAKSKDYG